MKMNKLALVKWAAVALAFGAMARAADNPVGGQEPPKRRYDTAAY